MCFSIDCYDFNILYQCLSDSFMIHLIQTCSFELFTGRAGTWDIENGKSYTWEGRYRKTLLKDDAGIFMKLYDYMCELNSMASMHTNLLFYSESAAELTEKDHRNWNWKS